MALLTSRTQIIRPLLPHIIRNVSRVLEDPSSGFTLRLHCFAVAFALLRANLLTAQDGQFTLLAVEAALVHGGLPLMYAAEVQECISALPVGTAVLQFADAVLTASREPLAQYFSLLSLVCLSFGKQRELVVFAEMEKTKALVSRLHESPFFDGQATLPVLLRLLLQLPPTDALSACLSDLLKLAQRSNAHLLFPIIAPLLQAVRPRVRLHPWITDAIASFLEVKPTSAVRPALTLLFLLAASEDVSYLYVLPYCKSSFSPLTYKF